MRHGKKFNHLGRTTSHRKAMLSNMAVSLIMKKRIKTTVAKAKALRKYVEPLITKAKADTTHNRRIVFSHLQDKEAIKMLFDEIGEKVAERNGGYTRIFKLGTRLGDNAQVAVIELVDYNEAMLATASDEEATGKTRRRRRKGGSKAADDSTATEATPEATVEEAPKAEAAPEEPAAAPKESTDTKEDETSKDA
ncbi:MAG: large subunit ribosomal protein L17 [Spirosomataceae bacterium]|jgi:large subunit ribosomal protein L17